VERDRRKTRAPHTLILKEKFSLGEKNGGSTKGARGEGTSLDQIIMKVGLPECYTAKRVKRRSTDTSE